MIERKTESPPVLQETIKEVETPAVHPSSTVSPKDSTTVTKKEEVNFDHLEKAAENLVDTWTAEVKSVIYTVTIGRVFTIW